MNNSDSQFYSTPDTISISGASGYIGSALTNHLLDKSNYLLHVLRHSSIQHPCSSRLIETQGNLLAIETLKKWPSEQSTVIHLAYLWNASSEENKTATKNLIRACAQANIKRLIHVSTAAVIGRSNANWVNEKTVCQPITEYARTKLHIEEIIKEGAAHYGFDIVILRPTSVYGSNGMPLDKLCKDIRNAYWLKNFLKTCLFGRRSMNLIHINNVVAALKFLIEYPNHLRESTYFLAEDDDINNNFFEIEKRIRDKLGAHQYPITAIHIPPIILSLILRLLGRNIVNPNCRFCSDQIESVGFTRPYKFSDGLDEYLDWYVKTYLGHDNHIKKDFRI